MTAGIISAVNRTITAPNNYSISGAIQTDAAINHGNSGGPLLNLSGQVIGVNAQIESDSGGNDGVGFAIPSDAVKSVAEHAHLRRQGAARLPRHPASRDASTGSGAQVTTVVSGSPADKAGLKAGDVITAIDGNAITTADDLTAQVGAHQPSDVVTVTVTRNGSSQGHQGDARRPSGVALAVPPRRQRPAATRAVVAQSAGGWSPARVVPPRPRPR